MLKILILIAALYIAFMEISRIKQEGGLPLPPGMWGHWLVLNVLEPSGLASAEQAEKSDLSIRIWEFRQIVPKEEAHICEPLARITAAAKDAEEAARMIARFAECSKTVPSDSAPACVPVAIAAEKEEAKSAAR